MSKKVASLSIAFLLSTSSSYATSNRFDFVDLAQNDSNFGINSFSDFEELLSDYNALPATSKSLAFENLLGANDDYTPHIATVDPQADFKNQRLKPQHIVDFAVLAYEAYDKGNTLLKTLQADGWQVNAFQTTTGLANYQIESVGGIVAFKGKNVVISTRGTIMTSFNDLATDVRAFSTLGEQQDSQRTNNYLYGVDARVAPGFFQSHLSSWEQIKQSIAQYANLHDFQTQDLHYTITGHSLGAAKALINAVNLLTDTDLQVGITRLDASFMDSEFDFHGIGRKSEAKNKGNVELITFEAPRAFRNAQGKGIEEIEHILGEDNVIRIENRGGFLDADPVVHVAPAFMGYKHVGHAAEVNQGFFLSRHMMSNVGPHAIKAIEEARKNADANREIELRQAHEAKLAQAHVFETRLPVANPVVQQKPVSSSGWFSSFKFIFGY